MPIGRILGAALTALLTASGPAAADALKDDAIARLAASHEPDVPQAVGRLAAKQAGLGAARALLARRGRDAGLGSGWNAAAPGGQGGQAPLVPHLHRRIPRGLRASGPAPARVGHT